jgi:tetraprenyl-beta-curcumene synthase
MTTTGAVWPGTAHALLPVQRVELSVIVSIVRPSLTSRAVPGPLTLRQLHALAMSAGRELRWGLWEVRRELAGWTRRAQAIEDADTRHVVLTAMDDERALMDGAALFWTLTPRRNPDVLRLLVALETLLNVIDVVLEHEARVVGQPGDWTRVVRDALDVTRPPPATSELRMLPGIELWVQGLVAACRAGCASLPDYPRVRPILVREAARSVSFEIEHEPDARRRRSDMYAYAGQHFPGADALSPWELTAGASSLMTAMAVIAYAGHRGTTASEFARIADAYVWVGSAAALLDSYTDADRDRRGGAHNWLTYYVDEDAATDRVGDLLASAIRQVAGLPDGERHVVLVGCMAALALTGSSVRNRPATARIIRSGGPTTALLVPALRAWRWIYQEDG